MRYIRNKRGASLMFVLAVMLLLMALGVSAITAAGLNLGASVARRDRNRLELYSNSMERTVKAALDDQLAAGAALNMPHSLTERMVWHALNEAYEDPANPLLYDSAPGSHLITVGMSLTAESPDGAADYEIEISGMMFVEKSPFLRYLGTADPDDAATSQSVMINGEIWITVTTTYEVPRGGTISMAAITTYRFNNGVLVEDLGGFGGGKQSEPTPGDMLVDEPGEWRFVRHEKRDI